MVNFTGLHSLLIKGCTNLSTCKASSYLISCLTLQLDILVVDPTQNLAAPMNVVALLPYLFINYEDANNLCITSAYNIVRVSTEKDKKLENLSTKMTLYSRRTFTGVLQVDQVCVEELVRLQQPPITGHARLPGGGAGEGPAPGPALHHPHHHLLHGPLRQPPVLHQQHQL